MDEDCLPGLAQNLAGHSGTQGRIYKGCTFTGNIMLEVFPLSKEGKVSARPRSVHRLWSVPIAFHTSTRLGLDCYGLAKWCIDAQKDANISCPCFYRFPCCYVADHNAPPKVSPSWLDQMHLFRSPKIHSMTTATCSSMYLLMLPKKQAAMMLTPPAAILAKYTYL